MVPRRQLYINGAWVAPARAGTLPVINPATEEVIGAIPAATKEDVDAAIEAACAAAKSGHWTKTTGAYRAGFLRAIAAKVGSSSSLTRLRSRWHLLCMAAIANS